MRHLEAGGELRRSRKAQEATCRDGTGSWQSMSILALVCTGWFGPAFAEKWTLEPAVETRATWSDNVLFDTRGEKRSDTLLELTPSLALRGEGKRFRIFGRMAVTGVMYANDSLEDETQPAVDLTANLEAIERFFFVEAGVVSRQQAENPFGPRPDGASSLNTVTTTQYRMIPSLEGRIGTDVQYRLRSSNSWTSVSGATIATDDGAYLGDHTLRVERPPTPFGWSVEGGRNDSRFESSTPPSAVIDSGRLALLYAFAPTLNIGLRGGYESTNLVIENNEQAIYGVQLNWRPSERTDLSALWEERFFGNSWRLSFKHRMPRLAWNVALTKDVASFPQAFLTLPPTDNVAALLDAAFTTRFPDAAERGRVVADLIARQGLPASIAAQTSLFSQRVSIVISRNVEVAYLGVRNSVVLSGFSSRSEDLPDSIFGITPGANIAQRGASLTFSHQASQTLSFNLTAGQTRSRGFNVDEGLRSKQTAIRLQATRQLAPRTSAYVGARAQKFESNVDVETARENAAFVGLAHRF
jgi:uncharacterized protein (PEP-CTERM system associated)